MCHHVKPTEHSDSVQAVDDDLDGDPLDNIITTVERLTHQKVREKERRLITRGADEIDLVRSGLEETMVTAYNNIRELKKRRKKIPDLRTAAFIDALNKVANDYMALGVFP